MIDHSIAEPPDRVRTNQRHGVEIHGDAQEVEMTLEACLQVQRWDRALALLKQLTTYTIGDHQIYFLPTTDSRGDCRGSLMNKSRKNIDRINRWVEVDMMKAGLQPDARKYALKIKVVLATLDGPKRDRTVRRYWEFAKDHDIESKVAELRGILTDHDLGKLSEICPNLDFDFPPGSTFAEDDFEVFANEAIAHKADVAVRETLQKGLGLSFLKNSLSLFSDELHRAVTRHRRYSLKQSVRY